MAALEKAREIIQDILDKLLTGYAPQKVILFGSYAYGDPTPDSDIDLLIIKETPERFIDRWVTVRRILSDPKRMVPLETLVLHLKKCRGDWPSGINSWQRFWTRERSCMPREESLYPADWLCIAEKDLGRVEHLLDVHDPEAAGFFL